MEDFKKISVVMCAYNGAKYLQKQLDSILAQSYPVYEIYIQDDGSTDETHSILKEYSLKYKNIRFKVNDQQLGINRNFFSAFKEAKGDYIAISDQDDIWLPDKIEKQIHQIQSDYLCFCRSVPFSSEENDVAVHFDNRTPNYTLERLIFVSVVSGHTILMRKDFLDLVPSGFDNLYFYDALFAMTATIYDKIAFVDEILVYQNRHTVAATYVKPRNYSINILNAVRLFKETIKLFSQKRNAVKQHYAELYRYMDCHNSCSSYVPGFFPCKDVVNKLSRQNITDLIKLSFWCFNNRNKIVYTNENNNKVVLMIRSLLFPILLYQYFDYK